MSWFIFLQHFHETVAVTIDAVYGALIYGPR